MKRIPIVLFLFALTFAMKALLPEGKSLHAEAALIMGLTLISAYLAALVLKRLQLPRLTGYMLLGLAVGPSGLNFLSHDLLKQLHFLEELALSFIALTAGGGFKYSRIKKFIKSVVSQLTGQLGVVFIGILILLLVFAGYLPFLKDLQPDMLFGFSILFAATALSTSPAVTIGIITELKARGYVTERVLSITILKSITLVIFFPLIIAWAKLYLVPTTSINMELLQSVATQIFGSILFGIVVGIIIILYLKYVDVEQSLFLLGTAIVIVEFTPMLNMEVLLTSIIAGIVVENFSKKGEALIVNIEKSSLPLYIIFFGFAGAGLHIDAIAQAFVLTVVLVVFRTIFLYIGNYLGAAVAGEKKIIKNISWLGYMGQAGIAVGLGTIIENTFPGAIGSSFKTILIASVVINELFGPIMFKYVLLYAKESTLYD